MGVLDNKYEIPRWLGSDVGKVLKTMQLPSNFATYELVTDEKGVQRKIVRSGTYVSSPYKGLVYNDADITNGDRIVAVMIRGSYIDSLLPASVVAYAADLAEQGLYAITEGAVTRPDFGNVGLNKLVMSTLGKSESGTDLTWNKVNGAVGYIVYFSAQSNGSFEKVSEVAQPSEAQVTFLTETNGYYKVQSLGDNLYNKDSDLSNAVQITANE